MSRIVTTKEEGLARCNSLKQRVIGGMQEAQKGLLTAAVSLYRMREEGVWRYDEEYKAFGGEINWNAYVIWLSRECDFQRSMLLEWVSVLRILEGGLGFTLDDVEEAGLDLSPMVQLKRRLKYNWKTGEIEGLRDEGIEKRLPPGNDLTTRFRQFVLENHTLPNPEERHKHVDELLGKNPDDRVHPLMDGPDHLGRYRIGWLWKGNRGWFGQDACPSFVADEIRRMLRIPESH